MEETIRRLAEKQHGVVGRRQLWAAGISHHLVQHRVDTGMLIRVSPEVLRIAGAPLTDAELAMAGVLDSPGAAFLSHISAAAWWGLPGFNIDSPVHTLIPRQGTERRTRLAIVHYHSSLPIDHLRQLNGVPITSPALTIFLLAGT
ncbi:MAG: type IV toxin-antitoxin system AbiEi family antitoxin domain-containing protein, partial [Acidimicrobiia bacterium]